MRRDNSANDCQTIRNWKQLASNIEAVYMVEASPALRNTQKELLCGDAEMVETEIGFKSMSKYGMPVIWIENIRFVPESKFSHAYSLVSNLRVYRTVQCSIHCSS